MPGAITVPLNIINNCSYIHWNPDVTDTIGKDKSKLVCFELFESFVERKWFLQILKCKEGCDELTLENTMNLAVFQILQDMKPRISGAQEEPHGRQVNIILLDGLVQCILHIYF